MPEKLRTASQPRFGKACKVLSVCSISIFALLLLLASLLAWGFGGSPLDNNPFDDRPFNRGEWLADQNRSDGGNCCGHMAQDIIFHHLKYGMSEQAIILLLGNPKRYSASEFKSYYGQGGFYFSAMPSSEDQKSDEILRYGLGEELDMAWGVDHADLYLYFRDGQYIGCRIGWPR